MSTRLLRDTGESLYGTRWQSELARDLGIHDRTMRRWISGADDMPSGVAMDLWRICEERAETLDEVIKRLKVAARP